MALIVDNASRPRVQIDNRRNSATHTVGFADSIHSVSRQHGVDPQALLAANPQIRDVTLPLMFGDVLDIPEDADSQLDTHTLDSGETVADVAQAQGVELQALLDLNGIDNPDSVYPGAELLLPAPGGAAVDEVDVPSGASPDTDAATQTLQQAGDIRADALAAVGVPVEDWTAAQAAQYTQYLNQAIEAQGGGTALADAVIVLSEVELQRSAELLGNATENKDDAKEDVKALTDNISILGNAASTDIASVLAMVVAEQIPEDSEQNWVDDGFGEYVDRSGNPAFLEMLGAALHSLDKGDAGDEMLHTSAGGVFGEGGVFDDVISGIRDFPGNAWEFARDRVLDPAGDWLRDRITDALGIEERIAALNEPGDSIFVGADIAGNLLGMDLGAAAGVKITLLDGGRYRLEVFGEGAAGVAAKLGIPGMPEIDVSSEHSLGVSIAFEFDSAAGATHAAEALAGMAVGVALSATPAAPVGAALIVATSDELGFIGDAYVGTSIELSQSLQASGDSEVLAGMLGIPSAELAGVAGSSVRIDIPADGTPPQLVYSQAIALDAELTLADDMSLPGGGLLGDGGMAGSVSLETETTLPIDIDFARFLDDPAGVVLDAVGDAASGATTTVNGMVELEEGVAVEIPGLDQVAGASSGYQIQFSAEAGTFDMFQAIGEVVSGDMLGGLSTLGSDAAIAFTLRRYTETSAGVGDPGEFVDGDAFDEPDGVTYSLPGIGGVEITAGYAQRNSEIVWEGSAGELEAEFGDLLHDASFSAS